MVGVDNCRSKAEADAKAFEFDRDRRDATCARGSTVDRHRKFATREEARGLTRHRNEVRFGERGDEPLLCEGGDRGLDRLPREPSDHDLAWLCCSKYGRVEGLEAEIRADLR